MPAGLRDGTFEAGFGAGKAERSGLDELAFFHPSFLLHTPGPSFTQPIPVYTFYSTPTADTTVGSFRNRTSVLDERRHSENDCRRLLVLGTNSIPFHTILARPFSPRVAQQRSDHNYENV